MTLGLSFLFERTPSGETWCRSLQDPLLVAAVVVLVAALIGVGVTMAAAFAGLVVTMTTASPIGHALSDPAWDPVAAMIFALVALSVIAGGIGNVLQIVASVAARNPFERANARRIERLGWRVAELWAIGWIARWLDVPVGGTINGFDISVDLGGGNTLAFALVLFVLARVFRHGNRLQDEVEGTV
ncbi:DUF2975 domain-containing protein [Novosphingobium beihaiensis]|uniref:DUF2975 domain-containing protein n=1 Tax=Novosphingobium beihaiensis TaxID=2930389 RepID=A0ABT0BVB1_9SPHN|nr:DUF2975 domain-containing protein [Novosphingobium beihaiensis]MCJ2188746.1 DUF2975 domain-containing protein [Novosphingobium beihaiensis]